MTGVTRLRAAQLFCVAVGCLLWNCPAWAAGKHTDDVVAVLGIIVGGPAIFVCIVLCLISAWLRRRPPQRWHLVYVFVVMVLSVVLGLVLPVWGIVLFGQSKPMDTYLFAFPMILAGAWSSWLAFLLQRRVVRGK